MIPLRDANPRRRMPVITYALIVLNVLAVFWQLSLGPRLEPTLFEVAFVPVRFWVAGYWMFDLFTIVLSMFLHGSVMHIGSNMLYLGIFGDNIEDRLGRTKYLVFYLACGFLATYAHAFFSPGSRLPAIGASGAIAGVLGTFLVWFPKAKLAGVLPLGCLWIPVLIPIRSRAFLFIPFWFALQFVGALTAEPGSAFGGVAWYAHLAGFAAGPLLARWLRGR